MKLPSQSGNRSAGLSLIEVMVGATIGSILLAVIGSLVMFTARSFVAVGNYADLDRASRNALDVLSQQVRQCRALSGFTTNKLTLLDNDNGTLIFEYSPATKKLTRQKGKATKVLLTECDYLNFRIFQRNPSNDFTFFPVSADLLATAKMVDISWKCSRKILDAKVNTESVQTAKIVIRN